MIEVQLPIYYAYRELSSDTCSLWLRVNMGFGNGEYHNSILYNQSIAYRGSLIPSDPSSGISREVLHKCNVIICNHVRWETLEGENWSILGRDSLEV